MSSAAKLTGEERSALRAAGAAQARACCRQQEKRFALTKPVARSIGFHLIEALPELFPENGDARARALQRLKREAKGRTR